MYHITNALRRHCAPAPATILLLALCLLVVGVQAMTGPTDGAALADVNSTADPALLITGPGLYALDHDLSSDATGVLINSSDVVLDGMGHSITGTGANGSVGILVTGRFTAAEGDMIANITIRNLSVRHWTDGIRVAEAFGTLVEDVTAEQNGVGLSISPRTGITPDHVVRDSVFRENTVAGISLSGPAEGVTLERCQATGNFRGLDTFDSGRFDSAANRIAGCDFSENTDAGVFILEGHFSEIDTCTIRGNGGDGLHISTSQTNITGNLVENNGGTGVDASDKSSSTITGNRIIGNGLGVATDTEFGFRVWNNLLNNTQNGGGSNLAGVGSLNTTKTAGPNIVGGPFIGGNFWAFPNGTGFSQTHPDLNHDGFCDEPYVLGESTTDFLPLAVWTGPANGSTPFKPLSVPGRIQAEDYNLGGEGVAYHDTTPGNSGGAYRHDDVDIETGNGVTDVGWIRDGEYLTYTVNVTQAGNYRVSARVASPNDARFVNVWVDGQMKVAIGVPNTRSFDSYVTVTPRFAGDGPIVTVTQTPTPGSTSDDVLVMPIPLTVGTHVITLKFVRDGQNLDWFELTPITSPTPTPTPEVPAPYKPLAIPGTIQAEDYDLGGEGLAYHDTTPGNEGGAYRTDDVDIETAGNVTNVGSVADGEFLTYTVTVAQSGSYAVTASVASPNSGRTMTLAVDDHYPMTLGVPNTGSLDTYSSARTPYLCVDLPPQPVPVPTGYCYNIPVTLSAGTHTLTLSFQGDDQNIDWFELTRFVSPVPTPVVPTPYRPLSIPGTIEAEDYNLGGEGVAYHDTTAGNSGGAYRQDDVDIETAGGITNVGWIRNGEWLAYTVNVTQAGTYTMIASAASPNSGRTAALLVDGAPAATIAVPNTGSFTAFRAVEVPVTLAAGTHTLRLAFAGDGQNLDRITFAKGPVTTPPTTPGEWGTPYNGPHAVPGRVEAEDYNLGGFSDTSAANEGRAYRNDAVDIEAGGSNYNVGWIRAGEYLEYTVETTSANNYHIFFRVANPSPEKTVTVRVNGVAKTMTIPLTGSFASWQTTMFFAGWLNEGRNTVRVETGTAASFNFDYMQFTVGETPPPTAVITTPVPPAGASFAAVPATGPKGGAVKFTVTPAGGKSISAAWWSFDATAHLNTWNSRAVSPTFYYPSAGTFSPLVKLTYTDGSTETVQRTNYVRAT